MNILFVSVFFRENRTHYRISRILREYNVCPHFISLFRKVWMELKKKGENVYLISDLFKTVNSSVKIDEKSVFDLENKYNIPSLRQLYLSDLYLRNRSEAHKVREVVNYLFAWEHFFDNHQIDYIVSDMGGELIRRTVYYVAKRREIPCIFTGSLPTPKPLVLSADSFCYARQISPIRPLSTSEKDIVKKYISNFKNESKVFLFNPLSKIRVSRIKRFLKHCYIDLFIEGNSDYLPKFLHGKKFVHSVMADIFLKFIYKKPNLNEKYFYLPLQVYDDFQLTGRAPHCRDQKYIVNLCSNALPYGYKLYVKEHPGHAGEGGLSALRKIANRKNVVLLSPETDNHLLVKNACGVITINSTVGFDALLYFKPVITLGYSFYRGYGLTLDVDNFFDLPAVIKKALDFKVDKEKLYSFIFALMDSTYEGRCAGDIPDEEIEKISNSILTKTRRTG